MFNLEDRLQMLEYLAHRYYGKYRGTVLDNQDPNQQGRLSVNVPEIHGDGGGAWAWPCVPYAGDKVGWHVLPPVGAAVWVEFEAGDVSKPIWVGCFWGSGQLPPEADGPDARLLQTQEALIKIDDSSGEVVVKNQNNASVTWTDEVKTEAGQATHTVGGDGVVSESAPGKLEVGSSGVKINDGAFTVS